MLNCGTQDDFFFTVFLRASAPEASCFYMTQKTGSWSQTVHSSFQWSSMFNDRNMKKNIFTGGGTIGKYNLVWVIWLEYYLLKLISSGGSYFSELHWLLTGRSGTLCCEFISLPPQKQSICFSRQYRGNQVMRPANIAFLGFSSCDIKWICSYGIRHEQPSVGPWAGARHPHMVEPNILYMGFFCL